MKFVVVAMTCIESCSFFDPQENNVVSNLNHSADVLCAKFFETTNITTSTFKDQRPVSFATCCFFLSQRVCSLLPTMKFVRRATVRRCLWLLAANFVVWWCGTALLPPRCTRFLDTQGGWQNSRTQKCWRFFVCSFIGLKTLDYCHEKTTLLF